MQDPECGSRASTRLRCYSQYTMPLEWSAQGTGDMEKRSRNPIACPAPAVSARLPGPRAAHLASVTCASFRRLRPDRAGGSGVEFLQDALLPGFQPRPPTFVSDSRLRGAPPSRALRFGGRVGGQPRPPTFVSDSRLRGAPPRRSPQGSGKVSCHKSQRRGQPPAFRLTPTARRRRRRRSSDSRPPRPSSCRSPAGVERSERPVLAVAIREAGFRGAATVKPLRDCLKQLRRRG
jgi:hypothetical protein